MLRFSYHNLEEIREDLEQKHIPLPVSEDLSVLSGRHTLYGRQIPNSLAIHPMEGCDAEADGSPSQLLKRRYLRFVRGGAGLLWIEACAVEEGGRANPRQLWIREENKEAFRCLVKNIRQAAQKEGLSDPFLVLQLTHSGRYCKPGKDFPAVIAAENPYLDRFLPKRYHVITDEELDRLQYSYVKAAQLAAWAGFDAVDIKACHRYLVSELLSSHTRSGRYGGNFNGRTRFLLEVVEKVKETVPEIGLASRMNAFDEIPYPYGFGVKKDDFRQPDFSEAIKLSEILYEKGVRLLNITGGNPYYNPHINRPADTGVYAAPIPQIHNVYKLLSGAKAIKNAVPGMTVIGTGLSWMREFGANIAAGCIQNSWFDIAGFGRQAFAYPDFARDILKHGKMLRQKCCIACSKCTIIMRNGGKTGCVVRDSEIYAPIYREGRSGKPSITTNEEKEHL